MKISIKLTLITLTILGAPMLQGMEQPKSLAQAIKEDDLDTIKWYIEEKKLDPFEVIWRQPGYNPKELGEYPGYCLFYIALMKIESLNITQYLLPLTEDWIIEDSLVGTLVNGPTWARDLLWNEAKKRGLDTRKNLNSALENAIKRNKPAAVQLLLAQGADRYGCFRINNQLPIDIANNELETAKEKLAVAMAHL